eukprot:gene4068-14284_t
MDTSKTLGSLRFVESAKLVVTKDDSLGFGLTRGNKEQKGFSSTAPRFASKELASVAPSQYTPKQYNGRDYSVSTKGTGAFASKSLARPSGRHARQPGPGDHNLHRLVSTRVDYNRTDATRQYAQPVARQRAVYDPTVNAYSKQGTSARGVYTAGVNNATPAPNAYVNHSDLQPKSSIGKGGTGVFKSGTIRGSSHARKAPGPAEYDPSFANSNHHRGPSTSTAAIRATSKRFKPKRAYGPPPGAYDPSVSLTKGRSPYAPQNMRDTTPHYRQHYALQHAPPPKAKHPGPASYNLSAIQAPKFASSSSMFKSRSYRTGIEQELARMSRVKANPGPGTYGENIAKKPLSSHVSHHHNADGRWI